MRNDFRRSKTPTDHDLEETRNSTAYILWRALRNVGWSYRRNPTNTEAGYDTTGIYELKTVTLIFGHCCEDSTNGKYERECKQRPFTAKFG